MAGARSSNCPLRVEYGSLTEELGQAFKIFKKYVKVHDLYFVATEKCPDEKILHGAWVLHQYIDNDGDGKPDNPLVYQKLVENKATMVMFEDEDHMERHIEKLHRRNERDKDVLIQDLQADETQPGSLEPDCFDASLEECFHLVTMGYIIAYPEVFGHHRGCHVADAMDAARGGRFKKVPKKYPDHAWFTYYDKTCGYKSMIVEYLYWGMTSILGAQERRREEIQEEWCYCTMEEVRIGDPALYNLLTDPVYKFPTKLPQPVTWVS